MGVFLPRLVQPPQIKRPRWNPADKGGGSVLTNNYLTADSSGAGGGSTVRANLSHSGSGKFYVEMFVSSGWRAGNNFPNVGMMRNTPTGLSGNDYPGNNNGGRLCGYGTFPSALNNQTFGYFDGNLFYTDSFWSGSDLVFMQALDLDNQKLFWGANGTWWNSGNPAAGAGAVATGVSQADNWFPAAGNMVTAGNNAITVRFDPRLWSYAAPSGFAAW